MRRRSPPSRPRAPGGGRPGGRRAPARRGGPRGGRSQRVPRPSRRRPRAAVREAGAGRCGAWPCVTVLTIPKVSGTVGFGNLLPPIARSRRRRERDAPDETPSRSPPAPAPPPADPPQPSSRRQPDPLRPRRRRLRHGQQPGHAHRRDRRAGRPVRPAGRAHRRGRRRRRAQAQPRLQPDPRGRAGLRARRPRPPPTTCSRPARPGWRRSLAGATRSASASSTPAIAGGVDSTSDAPIAVNDRPAPALLELNRAKTARARARRRRRGPPQAPGAGAPRHRRAAHRPVDGRAPGAHHAPQWGITREAQDELALASHQQPGRRLRARVLRRPGHPLPRR